MPILSQCQRSPFNIYLKYLLNHMSIKGRLFLSGYTQAGFNNHSFTYLLIKCNFLI